MSARAKVYRLLLLDLHLFASTQNPKQSLYPSHCQADIWLDCWVGMRCWVGMWCWVRVQLPDPSLIMEAYLKSYLMLARDKLEVCLASYLLMLVPREAAVEPAPASLDHH